MKNKIEIIRAVTRALAFIVPVITLCVALFFFKDMQDKIIGAVMVSTSAAAVFYYNKSKDNKNKDNKSEDN